MCFPDKITPYMSCMQLLENLHGKPFSFSILYFDQMFLMAVYICAQSHVQVQVRSLNGLMEEGVNL